MLERKKKVPEDDQEEKQRDSGCYGGRATLQSKFERKTKVTEDVREKKQSYRECQRGKSTLQRM